MGSICLAPFDVEGIFSCLLQHEWFIICSGMRVQQRDAKQAQKSFYWFIQGVWCGWGGTKSDSTVWCDLASSQLCKQVQEQMTCVKAQPSLRGVLNLKKRPLNAAMHFLCMVIRKNCVLAKFLFVNNCKCRDKYTVMCNVVKIPCQTSLQIFAPIKKQIYCLK